jgi:hypothetical protein
VKIAEPAVHYGRRVIKADPEIGAFFRFLRIGLSHPLNMATNPSDQDKLDFANDALNQLSDDKMVQQFEDNVKQVGTWANQVDASFDNVTRKFNTMVDTYGKDFPGFASYRDKWVGFNAVIPASFFFPKRSDWLCFPALGQVT